VRKLFSEVKLALLFLILVSILSGFTLVDKDPEKIVLNKAASQNKVGSAISVGQFFKRTPASVNVATDTTLSTQFFCPHEKTLQMPMQKVKKNMVMLSFKICLDEKLIQSVTLFNETNGFRAQIFKHDLGQYKTDYIQLNNGSNKVQAEVVLKDGQKTVDSLVILTGS
jgi:hypothetical protein